MAVSSIPPPSTSAMCKTLEKPLRLFTKLVCKRCQITYESYSDRLDSLNMISLFERRKSIDLIEFFKILNNNAYHPNHRIQLSKNKRHPSRLIRNPTPYDNENWFYPRSEKLWNSLCTKFVLSESIDSFKTQLDNIHRSTPRPTFMLGILLH